jgi:hypothetical protein
MNGADSFQSKVALVAVTQARTICPGKAFVLWRKYPISMMA